MGNCVKKACAQRQQKEKTKEQELQKPGAFVEKDGLSKGGFRVKLVLTKEELGWLMLKLKDKGGKGLEDILEEIEKDKGRVEDVKAWRPSLESIMEVSEAHEMDR